MRSKVPGPKPISEPNAVAAARSTRRSRAAGEQGYILLAVLFMVVLVLIALSVAAPKVAADIERDREVEMIHRGQQYVRAIKLYYKKFGAYPPNLDALEKTNEIRFLRKRYKDPITGKDEWHLIHFGENKTPSYGFFGQPIGGTGGSTLAGIGPGGVGQSIGSSFNQGSTGTSSAGGGLFGGSSFGNSSNSGTSVGATGTDPNAGNTAGAAGTTTGATTGIDSNSSTGGTGTGSSAFGSNSSNGQTFGGGGIIGVESTSPKLAILEWKKKKHFNEWEFWYDPNADRMMLSNNSGAIGQPAGSAGNGGANGTSGFGGTGISSPGQTNQTPTSPISTQPQLQ